MAWPLHFPPASRQPPCSWLRLVLLGLEVESLARARVCMCVCACTYTHIQHACKVWEGWRGEGRFLTLRFRVSAQMWGLWGLQRCCLPPHHQLLLLPSVSPTCQVQTSRQQSPGCLRALGWGLLLGYSYPNGDNFRQTHMRSSSKSNCIALNSSFYVLKRFVGRGRALSENYTLHLPFCCS